MAPSAKGEASCNDKQAVNDTLIKGTTCFGALLRANRNRTCHDNIRKLLIPIDRSNDDLLNWDESRAYIETLCCRLSDQRHIERLVVRALEARNKKLCPSSSPLVSWVSTKSIEIQLRCAERNIDVLVLQCVKLMIIVDGSRDVHIPVHALALLTVSFIAVEVGGDLTKARVKSPESLRVFLLLPYSDGCYCQIAICQRLNHLYEHRLPRKCPPDLLSPTTLVFFWEFFIVLIDILPIRKWRKGSDDGREDIVHILQRSIAKARLRAHWWAQHLLLRFCKGLKRADDL